MNATATLPQQSRNGARNKPRRRIRQAWRRRRASCKPVARRAALPRHRESSLWPYLALTLVALALAMQARAADGEIRGPDVTIIAGEERTIYEYRQNGELRMIKIVPNWGKPYYLVPRDRTTGFGDLERAEMLLPSWVLFEF